MESQVGAPPAPADRTRLHVMAAEVAAEALGRRHRPDPVLPGSGGPRGNAQLTAWTGLVLLVLFLAELVTVLDVRGLISWHVAVGVLLVPPALLKTASTGWRILRYYTGNAAYRRGGPPPLPLRVLGPLVVLSTLAVLASGLALIALGPQSSRNPFVQPFGLGIDALSIHKATFVFWAAVTGLHTLGRLLPALRLTMLGRGATTGVPGRYRRVGALVAALSVAAVTAALVLGAAGAWRNQPSDSDHRHLGRHAQR